MLSSSQIAALRQQAGQAAAQVKEGNAAKVLEMPLHIRARNDFFAFCEVIGKPVPNHIKRWAEAIITEHSSGRLLRVSGPHTNILAPRGSAKSVFTGLLCAWLIGIHTVAKKPLFIMYVSYNATLAAAKSKAVKTLVSSKFYQSIFPEVKLSKKQRAANRWAIDYDSAGINVLGEAAYTMVSTGLDGSVTGFRAHLGIIDDCIKSKKSIENPEIRRSLSDNWRQVLKPVLYEGARAICLGTRFHHNDIHSTDFCEKEGWKVLIQPALFKDKDNQWISYWPKKNADAYGFTVEFLLELKRKDPVAFAYQYQQEAVITSELSLDPRLIQRCQILDLYLYDQIVLGIDLSATANERSDYTAFCLIGRAGDQYHVIDFRQCRSLGNIEKLKLILDILVEWGFVTEETDGIRTFYDSTELSLTLAVETNAYQASMADDIRKGIIVKYDLDNVRVLQVTRNRGDKLQHFRGITTLFGEVQKEEDGSEKIAKGALSFNAFTKMEALFDQILNVGSTTHDDALDAFVIAAGTLKNRSGAGVE